MVSNAPRVHASDRAPAFAAPPFAMAASRDVVSGASARAVRPPVSARACLEHLCRALASLGVGVVPTEDASRGSRDRPRRALTAETLRRAKFDHPDASAPLWRAIHDLFLVCAAGFPNPSVAADALARVRGDADDVEDATCAALARHRLAEAGYPARATSRASPRATAEAARSSSRSRGRCIARGRLRPRARRRARAQPRIRRARRFPIPPPALPARQRRLTRRRARRRRARPRGRARATSTTRAPPSTRAETNTTPSETGPSSSASAARLGRRREPSPRRARRRAGPRGGGARRRRSRADANLRAETVADVLARRGARTRARASRRVRLRDRGANSPRVSAIPPRRPRDRRFLRPRTRCC